MFTLFGCLTIITIIMFSYRKKGCWTPLLGVDTTIVRLSEKCDTSYMIDVMWHKRKKDWKKVRYIRGTGNVKGLKIIISFLLVQSPQHGQAEFYVFLWCKGCVVKYRRAYISSLTHHLLQEWERFLYLCCHIYAPITQTVIHI